MSSQSNELLLKKQINLLKKQLEYYKTINTQKDNNNIVKNGNNGKFKYINVNKRKNVKDMNTNINNNNPSKNIVNIDNNLPNSKNHRVKINDPKTNKQRNKPSTKNDAVNASMHHKKSDSAPLSGKLLATKKQINSAVFKKYNIMLKVGVDLVGVITQMQKDKLSKDLINEFKTVHGENDKENEQETDPIKLAQKLNLPKKPVLPTPKESMKKLHWKPVKLTKIKGSIWNKVDQEWIDYSTNRFELKFQTRKNKPKLNKNALKSGVGVYNKDKNDRTKKVQFVDRKRSQQVQIGLKSYNMTNEELRYVILSLDDTKMNADKVASLMTIVPTPEEQIMAERMSEESDVKYFGIVERFFYSLYDIIELKPRLNKWLFKLQFNSKVNGLQRQITIVEKAKLTVTTSYNLRQILGILLAFGNHMNYGNKRKGNAYGFHMNDLALLPQIKTFDNSMTFPMFLYSFLERKYPKVLDIVNEFKIVEKASSITGETIDQKYDELVRDVKDLDQIINRFKDEYIDSLTMDDMFISDMTSFQVMAQKKLWKLKFKYNAFHKAERQLIEYLAYDNDESTITIQNIFKDLTFFIKMLLQSKIKLVELEKQKKKRAVERERKLKRRSRKDRHSSYSNLLIKKRDACKLNIPKKKQYALSFDDVGTPVADQTVENEPSFDNIMYLWGDQKIDTGLSKPKPKSKSKQKPKPKPKSRYSRPLPTLPAKTFISPLPQKINIISFSHFKKDNQLEIINPLPKSMTDKVRRNSLPSTPTKSPKSKKQKPPQHNSFSLSLRINTFESKIQSKKVIKAKKRSSVILLNSNSTPTGHIGQTANVTVNNFDGLQLDQTSNNNNGNIVYPNLNGNKRKNRKSRHGRKSKSNKTMPHPRLKLRNSESGSKKKKNRTFVTTTTYW